jgi:hypothetical protein
MKPLLLFIVWTLAVTPQVFAKDDNNNEAIIAAAKTYVAQISKMTEVTVTVEQVEGDYARAKVTPGNPGAADPAWVFLKKTDGQWRGLTLGTSFTVSDYQELEIPNALRVP